VSAERALAGLPGAPGVAVGPAWRYRDDPGEGQATAAVAVTGETATIIAAAADATAAQLDALAGSLRDMGREEEAGIFEAQGLMATDPMLLDDATARAAGGIAPDVAVRAAADDAAAMLAALDDDEHITRTLETNRKSLERLRRRFNELEISYVESYANFLLMVFPSHEFAARFTAECLDRGAEQLGAAPQRLHHLLVELGEEVLEIDLGLAAISVGVAPEVIDRSALRQRDRGLDRVAPAVPAAVGVVRGPDRVDRIGMLAQNFHADGALAGNHVRVVVGMDEG